MTIHLPSELDFLLREVASKTKIDITSIRSAPGCWQLNADNRKVLMDAVFDEFALSGLQSNDEPTARGLLLEDVLDRLNGIRQRQ